MTDPTNPNTGKRFGFGCMRLPVLDASDPASFDFPTIETLFDAFLERGFTYFDTAYTYHGYHAESAVRKALVERHPRESFELVTKMPLRDFKDAADLQTIFDEQLGNCGVDYFDFYLLHNLGHNVWRKCVDNDAFGFAAHMRDQGRIRNVGMSFHDTPELLEEILTQYGDLLDFVQLQVNYVDWEQPNVQSRCCLEVARAHGKPVAVMEPCKGGTLVNLPEEAEAILREANPQASNASWALRFAASQPGVFMVLSGMNTMGQLEDNLSTFEDFRPLDASELAVIERAREVINAQVAIPCTGCEYCTHGCPRKIAIPQVFALYNSIMRTSGSFSSQAVYYNNLALAGHGKASECIGCGLCERACPQHLPIRQHLKEVAAKFEAGSGFPTRK